MATDMLTAHKPLRRIDKPRDAGGVLTAEQRAEIQRLTGYSGFKDTVVRPLLHELIAIGITPFDPVSVETYKKRKKRGIENRGCLKPNTGAAWVFTATGTALLAMAIGGTLHLVFKNGVTLDQFLGGALLTAVACGVLFIGFLNNDMIEARWESMPMSGYNSPIPANVLVLAATVKREIENAELMIDELRVDRVVDPFLVVVRGGETYHIAVWDEPEFHDIVMED